tara:strand:- start:663 stop:2858 length:2196 start_codon:yes stop_codon:yes gene_type:complete
MKILFFDTETTGLPKNWKAPVHQLNNWPRLVQIAWQVYNSNGDLLEEHEHVIKPVGFIISSEAIAVHKITTEKALETGVDLLTILKAFSSSVNGCGLLVAHNYSYDYNIMGSELLRNGLENSLYEKEHICTMNASTEFCKIPGPYGSKWPKLEELYDILFSESFNAHDALDDIRATARCFWELEMRGIIFLPKIKEIVNLSRNNLSEKSKNIFNSCYELTKKIIDIQTRGAVFESISKTLMSLGQTEEAIRVISEIPIDYTEGTHTRADKYLSKSNAYAYISINLMERRKFDNGALVAIKCANKITDTETRNKTYFNIVIIFLELKNLKKALELIPEIKKTKTSSHYLRRISIIVMQNFNIDEALNIVLCIPDDFSKNIAYKELSEILFNQGNKDDALNIVAMITDEKLKNSVYEDFSKISIDQGNKDEALKHISKIYMGDDWEKDNAYKDFSKISIDQGNKDEALKYASKIKSDFMRDNSFEYISTSLMKRGQKHEAIRVAHKITKAKVKDSFYYFFAVTLMERGEIEEALKIAAEITTQWEKDNAYSSISLIFMGLGKKYEALEIASEISDYYGEDFKYLKNRTYNRISQFLLDQLEFKEAIKVFKKMTGDNGINENYEDSKHSLQKKIISFLIKYRRINEAFDIAIQNFDVYMFNYFIKELTKLGMTEKAMNFVEGFPNMENEFNSYNLSSHSHWSGFKKSLKDSSYFIISQSLLKSIEYKEFKDLRI